MQFLSGNFGGKRVVRPPWALDEERFTERCNGCGKCIEACPYDIIHEARGKFPVLDFATAGCDFCRDCVSVCETGALVYDVDSPSEPWNLKAAVLPACLAMNGVVCRSCGEACETQAIRFRLELGGIAQPKIDQDACTGCGECYAVCPIRSVEISPSDSCQRVA